MGRPKGCLNNATTANQSAKAPTIPASANARMYPTTGCNHKKPLVTKKMSAITNKRPVAKRFIFRSFFLSSSILPKIYLAKKKTFFGISKKNESSQTSM
jgi:hypothetical protein